MSYSWDWLHNDNGQMSTVTAVWTTHDVHGNDVGGPLGHPQQPAWSAVDSSGIQVTTTSALHCIQCIFVWFPLLR